MIPHSRPDITTKEIEAVVKALKKKHISEGPEIAALEQDLSAMFGGAEVIVVSSGTAALFLSLTALGLGKGDLVVIPSYTCNSLFSAVSYTGATPLCADSGLNSVNITAGTVTPIMKKSVKALVIPHTCGFIADIDSFSRFKRPIIEDCAQCIGARHSDGSLAGTKGDVAILSFFATKLLPGGEGGACITRNSKIAETIRMLKDPDKRVANPRAFNFKMPDMNAALAREKLKTLKSAIKERSRIADIYDEAFGPASFRRKSAHAQPVCFRYILDTVNAKNFIKQAESKDIICSRPVWGPIHHTIGGHCPSAEKLEHNLVSAPIYPSLTSKEIDRICKILPPILSQKV